MREDRKRAAVEALGLPRDVILGDVLLHFTGPYEVVAENFRSLLIYTDTYVKIKAAGCMVVFKGLHLEIETYTEDALKIKGQIRSVEFDDPVFFSPFKRLCKNTDQKHQPGIFSGTVQDKRDIFLGTGMLEKGRVPMFPFFKGFLPVKGLRQR